MRRRRTEHRVVGHWIALTVALGALAAALGLQGYARHEIGHASTQGNDRSAVAPGLDSAGPVLDLSATAVTSRSVPDHEIALTFDDGPDPHWTPRVLDVLKRHHVHATFFMIGSHVAAFPSVARRVVAEGHDIGNHTFTHIDLLRASSFQRGVELRLTEVALAAAVGRHTILMRPPYSSEPDAVRVATLRAWREAAGNHYLIVLSTLDSDDWQPKRTVAQIEASSTPADGKGAIVLMHDGGGSRDRTVKALDHIITALSARGYRFVTVSEMLHIPPATAMPAVGSAERLRDKALPTALTMSAIVTTAFTWFAIAAAILAVLRALALVLFARRHALTMPTVDAGYTPDVTILVPAYNEAAGIAAAVRSLARSDYPAFEVIVIDDGSTDDTSAIVASVIAEDRFDHVRLMHRENGGKSKALNTGITHARGEIVVTVDGDTVFAPETLGLLVQPFADPTVGAVSGNTKVANRKRLLGRWQHLEYVMGFNLDRRMYDRLGCMPTVPGAIGAFRRQALLQVSGFTDDTLAEDTEITMSLQRAGWRVAYEPRAIAWTEAPSTMRDLWRQRYRWSYGTMQSVWKHRGAIAERGPGGRLGRRGLPYLILFQIALPLFGPAVDVFTLYGVIFLSMKILIIYWLAFTALQVAVCAYALRLDRESLASVWVVPLQQFVYRQLMYLVVLRSAATAAAGARVGWHKLRRTGAINPIETATATATD